jgi:hypothetical protein
MPSVGPSTAEKTTDEYSSLANVADVSVFFTEAGSLKWYKDSKLDMS